MPVFAGTDQVTLNRGAGLVEGTALPGESGNVVVSAHRDTFFRPLQHIEVGDEIELVARDRTHYFTVTNVSITDALDVGVLDAQAERELTLITCYPFQYVGFAPDRFVVRAVPVNKPVQAGASIRGFGKQTSS